MSFLTPFLFVLSAFLAVPVLLHLIRKRRVRILDFPTYRFLKKAAMEQRLHLRLQDRVLMILRLLVLLTLVLAFAGPTTRAVLEKGTPVLGFENFLIIDDSRSMDAVAPNGKTYYEAALDLGRKTLRTTREQWTLLFASDLKSVTAAPDLVATDPTSFEESVARHPRPVFQGSVSEAAVRMSSLLDPEKAALWLMTDAAASNWPQSSSATELRPALPIEVLRVTGNDSDRKVSGVSPDAENPGGPGVNWAITSLTLNNQPLLEDEPGLLNVRFQSFGEGSSAVFPEILELAWYDFENRRSGKTVPLNTSSLTQGMVDTLLAAQGKIRSVSASLKFRKDRRDPLPGDDTAHLAPSVLDRVHVGVLASPAEWRMILRAALVGFRSSGADPTRPPEGHFVEMNGFLLLLGDELPHREWIEFLRSRVESGAGLLVCYDGAPQGIRREVWAEWWSGWGKGLAFAQMPKGIKRGKPGDHPWFVRSLDPTARNLEWAGSLISLPVLEETPAEWLFSPPGGSPVPVFQTRNYGEGIVASWNVPLSPDVTSLIVRPGWVPLLSQMIKRTLIEPAPIEDTEDRSIGASESDLTRLAMSRMRELETSGWRFSDAENIVDKIENLPSRRHDWTSLVLVVCLILACVEIAVSNYV